MKRSSVIDFFGVLRVAGYALAALGALLAGALWLAHYFVPVLRVLVPAMLVPIIAWALLLAWSAGLCRVFVRRMHFESPQD